MTHKWFIYITVLIILEYNEAKKPKSPVRQEAVARISQPKLPLIARPKVASNIEERRLGQDYIEQYQDMLKASQESFENFDERDDKRLRRLIGEDDLGLMAEAGGVGGRRRRGRSGGRVPEQHSAVGRRRARSQAVRRNKLTAQSLTSHKRHSRTNNIYGDNLP